MYIFGFSESSLVIDEVFSPLFGEGLLIYTVWFPIVGTLKARKVSPQSLLLNKFPTDSSFLLPSAPPSLPWGKICPQRHWDVIGESLNPFASLVVY